MKCQLQEAEQCWGLVTKERTGYRDVQNAKQTKKINLIINSNKYKDNNIKNVLSVS